ncbi:MAG: alkaline phosphatase family protein [Candidatus Acetothermia bacterium]|jgi:predicted AlkP superfamily phosphohydrolase/phosphomutase|nr:alkaline phosphatase family protein [Candidatus Acetothermia bacterium]
MRLALIGLDCVDPELLSQLLPDLPTLAGIVRGGSFLRLRSVDPPITVPAWMCMMTGKDPGELGVYGFRNRADHSYTGLALATSTRFTAPAAWDILGRYGLSSVLLGIPGTYPPKPVRGWLVSGFPAPEAATDYTYPTSLADDVRRWIGGYAFDVREFRTEDKAALLDRVRTATANRFALARRMVAELRWDFFAMVEMGPDRVHHAFWADHDPTHPKHGPRSPFRDALRDYYRFLDHELGELLAELPARTQVLVASDHGAQPMRGGIAVNEWLLQEGYLALHEYPGAPTRMEALIREGRVDWSRTIAWGEGGYYGRVFLNVAGREPEGVVPPGRYEEVRAELAERLTALPDEHGRPLGTRVLYPERTYRAVRGIPPDLLVYFGDLAWRSIGTVGWNRIHLHANDTGPDDANHAPCGILIADPPMGLGHEASILEVKDLILRHFGVEEQG